MLAHIQVQKAAVVNADAASRKVVNGLGQLVHLLQDESMYADVRSFPQNVLAVGCSPDAPVVSRAAISRQNQHGLPRALP